MIDTLAVFDVETTGVDVETDRIVTAYVGTLHSDGTVGIENRTWLINPGIPIPEAASAIHHIDDLIASKGEAPAPAILDIATRLQEYIDQGIPIVVYNAPFDLTLLDREFRRHHGWGLESGGLETEGTLMEGYNLWRPILDPLVIDKALDRYRRGSRRLVDVAAHYGVDLPENETAHDASVDALLTGRLAFAMLRTPSLQGKDPAGIHDRCIEHAADQAESYADYLRGQGKDASGVNGQWPIRAWKEA